MAYDAIKLIGDKKLVAKLYSLEKRASKRIQRAAVRSGAAIMRKGVRAVMPTDTGAAKKSIDYKITSRGGAAIIGAKEDYQLGDRKPSKYIHLIEYGHIAPNGRVIPGQHPIERGAKNSESAVARKMEEKARAELEKML